MRDNILTILIYILSSSLSYTRLHVSRWRNTWLSDTFSVLKDLYGYHKINYHLLLLISPNTFASTVCGCPADVKPSDHPQYKKIKLRSDILDICVCLVGRYQCQRW